MERDDMLAKQLKDVKHWKQQYGKSAYVKYLNGEKLTRSQAIAAKCYECNGNEATCYSVLCPLYPLTQFKEEQGD